MTDPHPPAFTGPDLCRKEAHEVVALLQRGAVSPDELIDAALTRLEQVEGAVNAVPTLCPARAHAQVLGTAGAEAPGWLAGLPIGIKDLTPVEGVRTTFGTRGLADFVPETSDYFVTRLESRGGIVLGKTNTPEFGAGANTFNDVFGPTFNPWDTTLNAGGSSGGAAVSLATGSLWLSHGSDHGGSLRTPAAFNGIVGLRPSPGRVARMAEAGFIIEGAEGPMARSVRDCALFLDAMAGADARDPLSYPAPETPFETAVIEAEGKLTLAYSPDLNGFGAVDAEMADHLAGVMATLARAGHRLEETCPDLTGLEPTYHTLRGIGMATAARTRPEHITRHLKQTIRENTARALALTIDDIAAAEANRGAIYRAMAGLFDSYDVFALPVVGCMPHPQSEEWVREIGGQTLEFYMDWLRFAFLATTAGLPAISVPVGLGPRGLPVGLQLIGPPRGEAQLLRAARIVEAELGGPLGPIDPVTRSASAPAD